MWKNSQIVKITCFDFVLNGTFVQSSRNLSYKSFKKYVGVQNWKATHLPTLDIRVEQKGSLVVKDNKKVKKMKKKKKGKKKNIGGKKC